MLFLFGTFWRGWRGVRASHAVYIALHKRPQSAGLVAGPVSRKTQGISKHLHGKFSLRTKFWDIVLLVRKRKLAMHTYIDCSCLAFPAGSGFNSGPLGLRAQWKIFR